MLTQNNSFQMSAFVENTVIAWMERQPDISERVRVVHLVRDPRAIYASRRSLVWCNKNRACGSPESICGQLRTDLDDFEELAARIGDTSALRIRFEDLAANAVNETVQLFAKLELQYTPSVLKYIEGHANASVKDMKDPYSTRRKTSIVANAWMRKLSVETIRSIQRTCNDTLLRLGYDLL
ncbi:hypothetical protein HPB48_023042 [Haemaphysalis longicornis]|uniref:Sulfotransferase n=1 Tax=Haemaphysalis longicornis TaxID=44386 RepID=A0A9J6GAJ8_HAELO|nr:hypothetical protein HPB48_023042 [Haemaphysalis longicornis]